MKHKWEGAQRKVLYKRERDALEGPHEEAETQRMALRRGRDFGLQRRYMFRKGKSAVEGDPKKVGVWLKRRLKRKEGSSRGKWTRWVFLCRRRVRIKAIGKVIPVSFLKVEEWGTLLGAKNRRERQLEELVGDQSPSPEAPPRNKRWREWREKRRCQERSDGKDKVCQDHWGAEDITQSNTFPHGGRKYL